LANYEGIFSENISIKVICWLLFVGCYLLVVGCWLLVVICWLLGVSSPAVIEKNPAFYFYVEKINIQVRWKNSVAWKERTDKTALARSRSIILSLAEANHCKTNPLRIYDIGDDIFSNETKPLFSKSISRWYPSISAVPSKGL
jgi:hypothetical protein